MNKTDTIKYLKYFYRTVILKGLLRYMLFPLVCLIFLARPIGEAVRGSDAAVFLILLAALGAVCVNWLVYGLIYRKRPSLLVLGNGVFWILVTGVIELEALPGYHGLSSTLAVICGCLLLACMFLVSYWLAPRPSKAAHIAAVGLWTGIGVLAAAMLYQVIRDFEARIATVDTWITIGILAALVPAAFARKIRSAFRRGTFRRRATGLAEGRIVQLIGETRLDLDDDPVTDFHARIQYAVDGATYEIRTGVTRTRLRRYGKEAFAGKKIDVHYDPENPGEAFTDPLDRRYLSRLRREKDPAETGEAAAAQ